MNNTQDNSKKDCQEAKNTENQQKNTCSEVGYDADGNNIANIKDARIAQLEEECAKLKDSWVRSAAETENIRKRSQRELEESRKYAITAFAGDMVSVLENLKRAAEVVPSNQAEADKLLKTLSEGINLTLQELLNIFQKYGITRIDPIGKKFDHNLHQAVAQIENNEVESGTVIQVIQAGYVISDRLLRPAMVAVAKNSDTNGQNKETNQEKNLSSEQGDTKKLDTTA